MCQGLLANFSDGHRSSFISWTAVISGSTPPEMEEEGGFLSATSFREFSCTSCTPHELTMYRGAELDLG
jgi:hypothetical protein